MHKSFSLALAAFLCSVVPILAQDPPQKQMKEGLWSIHSVTTNNPGNKKSESSSTLCRSHAYDEHARAAAKEMKGCVVNQKFEPGKFTSESKCVVSGTTIETKGTTTYSNDSAAHVENHATYNPPMGGITDFTMVMDQKYLGSCPAGVQPGDVTLPNGSVNHLWKH